MDNGMSIRADDFARAFGDALRHFLDENSISVTEAASKLRMNKQTLSTYWANNSEGKRPNARAELLFLACSELGFAFEFNGSTVRATPATPARSEKSYEQLQLPFAREFSLADEKGSLSVDLKRPAGELELTVRLRAIS
jgi:transcriptional regulator with XRE-family HTH domain